MLEAPMMGKKVVLKVKGLKSFFLPPRDVEIANVAKNTRYPGSTKAKPSKLLKLCENKCFFTMTVFMKENKLLQYMGSWCLNICGYID